EDELVPLTKKEVKAPRKRSKPAATKEQVEENRPDASIVLEGRNWQVPTGHDIRDILSELEKE
ncbi:MAG TPA: hypothetical protein VNX28_03290, partial [Gemmataceae bacterium]|nr:hypothetical protein [Gemmataceae bacterium]